jgi:hypothetical protein
MLVPLLGACLLILASILATADWMARRLLYPPQSPITRTPRECGLAYDDAVFPSADGLRLRGWWTPADMPPGHQTPTAAAA